MIECAVYGCGNNSVTATDTSVQYYCFPKQPEIVEQWIRACSWQGNTIDLNTARICSIHFTNDCFTTEYKILNHLNCYTKVLKYDAVPTLYLNLAVLNTDLQIQNRHFHTTALSCVENFTPEPTTSSNMKIIQTYPRPVKAAEDDKRLNALKQENKTLQRRIDDVRTEIDHLRNTLNKTNCKYRNAKSDYNSTQAKYWSLQAAVMGIQKQKNLLAKVFSESQIKILSGKKKIYWSNDDMAMAYTIRHLSNRRCYTYLSKNLNFPLPALSSMKRWASIKKRECKTEEKEQE